jgi:tetratricopeptide (TPR) repeat protein
LKDPTNVTWLDYLAPVYIYLGGDLVKTGDLATAIQEYHHALEIRNELAVRDPTNSFRQETFARYSISYAELLVLQKHLVEGLQHYQKALEKFQELAQQHPGQYQFDIFGCYIGIGDIDDAQSDHRGALETYRLAFGIAQQLASNEGAELEWQRNLLSVYVKIGDQLVRLGDSSGAVEQYTAAVAIVEKILQSDQNSPYWKDQLQMLKNKIQGLFPAH